MVDRKNYQHREPELPYAGKEEFETYRVIVLGRGGAEVLLVPDCGQYTLPSVSIPRWQRVAENLTAAFKLEWGHEVVCLFTLDFGADVGDNQVRYQVAEHWRLCSGEPRAPTQWVAESDLSQNSFADLSDYKAIEDAMATCRGKTLDGELGPFVRPGWFRDLYQWAEAVTEPEELHLSGAFRQLNASPTFSLIRFETDGPALWFKAVGEPNQREFSITLALAQLFPHYVPPVLATRPEWNGWLAREADGISLDQTQDLAVWKAAAATLAKFQIESICHKERILASGPHDLRAVSLSDLIQPFMETMATLMDQQTKKPPPVLSPTELVLLGKSIQEALDVVVDSGIPDALGHLDLNPGNIIVAPQRCAFLDWAEAYVGNPFFSLQYLVEYLRRVMRKNPALEAGLVESYCAQWEMTISPVAVARALHVAPLLAVFAYAAGGDTWNDAKRLQQQVLCQYLRSLTRRMNREANELARGRSACRANRTPQAGRRQLAL